MNDSKLQDFAALCRESLSESGGGEKTSNRFQLLDKEIRKVGPWWLGHFLVYSEDDMAKEALELYMTQFWPEELATVRQMIDATHWHSAGTGAERDFGSD